MNIMCLTDSTGDSQTEWTYQFAQRLADVATYPIDVTWQSYDDGTTDWTPSVVLDTPDAIVRHTVWSGAVPGAGTQYHIDNAATILQHPVNVDSIFIALGANQPRDQATYQELIDLCRSSWPLAAIYLTYQNPWLTNDPWGGPGAGLMYDTVTALAIANKLVSFDVWSAFIDLGDFSSLMLDNVHPNEQGNALWVNTVWDVWGSAFSTKDIPDATSWSDSVGRTWAANGSGMSLDIDGETNVTLSATQSGDDVLLQWVATEQEVRIERVSPDPEDVLAIVAPNVSEYLDFVKNPPTVQTTVSYRLAFLAAGVEVDTLLTYRPADAGDYTYGQVDMLATRPRYANIDTVKRRIGVEDSSWDTEITQAIIAAETTMDVAWGRSFPDTGINPRWPGIPVQVTQAAENIAIAVLKQTDAPFGVAGSDAFALGEIDIDDLVRRELYRSPLLRSFKVAAGFGLAR